MSPNLPFSRYGDRGDWGDWGMENETRGGTEGGNLKHLGESTRLLTLLLWETFDATVWDSAAHWEDLSAPKSRWYWG